MLIDDLERHARERPDALAVAEASGRELSWSALHSEVERLATRLLELGVARGESVAFQLPNRLEFVVIALATLRIGAACEPLMPIFRERELQFMLRESAARVLFVPDQFRGHDHAGMAHALRDAVSSLEHILVIDGLSARRPSAGEELQTRGAEPTDIAQLLFTSGSTGEPKGVLHRHEVLDGAADAHIRHFGLGADDVIYVPSPLAHQTGFLYGMWIAIRLGVPQVLQDVWNAELGVEAMRRYGVTFVQAATPFLADLTALGERPEALRTFVATGAAIPRELARAARKTLRAEVGGAWGTTESCLGTAFAPGEEPELSWQTDGRPLEGVTLRVVDDRGEPLPAGAEGNFEVRTPWLFDRYLNRPEATAEALTADGFYRTGDLARLGTDGHMRITGRVKDVINRGGEKVPVAEIEQLLFAHPAVREVAIVAMPDERLGERACAFVVLEPGAELDLEGIRAHLDSHRVSKTYWPERLETIDSLPKTPSGKIRKYVLRELAQRIPV
jgi:3-phosphoshikimate 1-carboxyvinyltransferase